MTMIDRGVLERARNDVIGLDVLVDDARRDLDRAVDVLRVAVREGNRAAVHLAQLIDIANRIEQTQRRA